MDGFLSEKLWTIKKKSGPTLGWCNTLERYDWKEKNNENEVECILFGQLFLAHAHISEKDVVVETSTRIAEWRHLSGA